MGEYGVRRGIEFAGKFNFLPLNVKQIRGSGYLSCAGSVAQFAFFKWIPGQDRMIMQGPARCLGPCCAQVMREYSARIERRT